MSCTSDVVRFIHVVHVHTQLSYVFELVFELLTIMNPIFTNRYQFLCLMNYHRKKLGTLLMLYYIVKYINLCSNCLPNVFKNDLFTLGIGIGCILLLPMPCYKLNY